MPQLARSNEKARTARSRGEAALLTAAEALVDEGTPYADLAIEAIARRAGFSRATFYAYFPDKRAMVLRLGERFVIDLETEVGEWLSTGRGDVRDSIAAALRVFRRHRGTVIAVVEAATYDDEVAAFWRALHERFVAPATARVAVARPGLSDAAAQARAFTLVWATERCFTEHLSAPRVDEGELIESLSLLWEGFTETAGAAPIR